MSTTSWQRIVGIAVAALAGEFCLGCPFCFAPGWANDWPGSLSIYVVWSAGMTGWISLILLTLAVAVGGPVGLVCSWRGLGQRWGRPIFVAWIAVMAIVTLLASWPMYQDIHRSALEMWPDGYPNPQPKG